MFETIMRLYFMAMAFDVRSPMPHIVGPPGSGKSTVIQELADMLEVDLHIINVSRLSPLEVEGVQMPHGNGPSMALKMLPAVFWTRLKEGDIILMDEFLRGFPEVYNALLDIFTSRRVGHHVLPKVFIIGASNSVTTYDAALEDRLIHIPVPDPRRSKAEREKLGQLLVEHTGMNPAVVSSTEMETLLQDQVLPSYQILDVFKKKGQKVVPSTTEYCSIRNLIGQTQLRQVQVSELKALIDYNNIMSMNDQKPQFVVLLGGEAKHVPTGYESKAEKLRDNPMLSDLQRTNLEMNLQLIQMESARKEEA